MKKIYFLALFFLTAGLQAENEVAYLPEDQLQPDCNLPSAREEKDLFSQINPESRRLYNSLDCKGKNQAMELSKQYRNKNIAIQEAAKEMGRRQKTEYPNQRDYQQQLEERSGQDPYNERYGY